VEAEAAYRQAITLDPKYAKAYYGLGTALSDQKKYVEAEAAYRQAITLDPKYAAAYFNLGKELAGQHKDVEAEAAYRQAITLDPKNAKAYFYLGMALVFQYKNVEAEAAFRQELMLDPKNAFPYNSLGNSLRDQKKYVEAEAAYRQAISLDPKFALPYNNLGTSLRDQKKYVEAEAAYRQAISLDPKFAFAYNNLGFTLQELGRLTEARDLYLKAIKLRPAETTYRSNLEEVERLIAIAGGTLKPLSPAEASRYLDPQDPLAPVRRSVVRILPTFSGNSSGAGAHGTGFVVRRQGDKALILTARHVIRDPDEGREATGIQIELYGGNLPAGIVASRVPVQQIKSGNGDLDLALLVVVGLPEDIQPLNFSSLPVKDGMPLTMVGHPGRENWKNITGTLLTSDINTLIVKSGQMAEGGSGSPVLSHKAELIGMIYTLNEPAPGLKQVVGYSRTKLQETLRQWGQ
jgi:superkiller protein 3